MWLLVVTLLGCGEVSTPFPVASEAPTAARRPAAGATIDCSMHDDPACDTAKSRLAQIDQALARIDCTKGGEAKRSGCRIERDQLERERSKLLSRWSQGYEAAAEDEAAGAEEPTAAPAGRTRSRSTDPMGGGGGDDGMEIEVNDE